MSCTVNQYHDNCQDVTHKIQFLKSENARLKDELKNCEKFATDYEQQVQLFKAELDRAIESLNHEEHTIEGERISIPSESWNRLIKDRDRWKSLAAKLAEALKAQVQMRNTKEPKKMYEHMTWRDNDEHADKLAKEALAEYESVKAGK
jgi:predicted RNase H-like nuclease (RuvC/YqgF family)